MFFKIAQKVTMSLGNFVQIFIKNFKKSPNLITLIEIYFLLAFAGGNLKQLSFYLGLDLANLTLNDNVEGRAMAQWLMQSFHD